MNTFDIVPTHLAVKAMRDNGYKNAAYAIAELLDNAIQAGATLVELLCAERRGFVKQRDRSRIHQVAVLDNGCGMDADQLRTALQFGNGTRLESGLVEGIGRFGMGLPSSSISQCSRVEVWSWQDGHAGALYTYLDLNEVISKKLSEVPKPIPAKIPKVWLKVGEGFQNKGKSGTLVVWSELDRCNWYTARAIIENSELVIGRMYRKFLDNGKIRIRLRSIDFDTLDVDINKLAEPNDPLYLMRGTSTPKPWDHEPMFEAWGNNEENKISIKYKGKEHIVNLRFSVATEKAREGQTPGDKPHGKHAAKNVGVSVVRAERELELDASWTIQYDPTERWWGCEVEFQPGLDELFGVTNNKQHAHNFSEMSKLDFDELLKGGKTMIQLQEEMEDDNDPRAGLLPIAQRIKSNLSALRKILHTQSKGKRSAEKRHDASSPEARATEVTKVRKAEGYKGESDKDESLAPSQKKETIQAELVEQGIGETDAAKMAEITVQHNLKYLFSEAHLETSAFFSVRIKGGALIVTLNSAHPAYNHLIEVLQKDSQNASLEELRDRLNRARDGLKLLLEAWARYEDEQPDSKRRTPVQQAREDWGRIARQFLESDDVTDS